MLAACSLCPDTGPLLPRSPILSFCLVLYTIAVTNNPKSKPKTSHMKYKAVVQIRVISSSSVDGIKNQFISMHQQSLPQKLRNAVCSVPHELWFILETGADPHQTIQILSVRTHLCWLPTISQSSFSPYSQMLYYGTREENSKKGTKYLS